jgi:hypothetical protein
MKTDIIEITPSGEGIAEALRETEKTAVYRGLDPKQSLRLRLLAEEMTGMLKTLVGDERLHFWIESQANLFSLHLSAQTYVDAVTREALLKTSTSGKNAAATGFMGRLRDYFTRVYDTNDINALANEMGYVGLVGYDASMDMSPNAMLYGWSLNAYRQTVSEQKETETEKWDELEKSITAKLADEVKIFIRKNTVEMVIEKGF